MTLTSLQQLELNIPEGIRHTATGVHYPAGLSLDQLVDHRRFCARAHASSIYWLTANSRQILKDFGAEALQQAVAMVELEQDVTRDVEALLKLEVAPVDCLSPKHHVVLALSDQPESGQAQWLKLAVEHHLTPLELRKSMIAGKVLKAEPPQERGGVPSPHAVRQQFDFWQREIGEKWRTLSDGELSQLASLLGPIGKFLVALDGVRAARAKGGGR